MRDQSRSNLSRRYCVLDDFLVTHWEENDLSGDFGSALCMMHDYTSLSI